MLYFSLAPIHNDVNNSQWEVFTMCGGYLKTPA